MISAIVAVDNNWGIGYNGDLLISIPDDLKHFKDVTSGHTVVMGLNTWNSLPKKPLPNRLNIVIDFVNKINYYDGYIVQNLENTIEMMKFSLEKNQDLQFFIMGGGSIYRQLLPYCDKVYVTKINKTFDNVDTYFPNLDTDNDWEISKIGEPQEYNNIPYSFCEYSRTNLTNPKKFCII